VGRNVLIERDLIGAMATAPESVAVAGLIHRDPVDPGAKARLAAETMDGAEDSKEDVLGQVERLVPVAQQVHRELDDHPLMLGNQLRAGGLLAGCTPLHKRRLAAADVRPCCDPSLLH